MKSIGYLQAHHVAFKEIHLTEIPRTAQDVERLYGCPLQQVLKTLIFIGDKQPIVVVLSGDKKVNLDKLKKATGENTFRIATPAEVQEITGYTIGGVSPFGLKEDLSKVIDEHIFEVGTVNIGSGKAEIGIELTSAELWRAWDGVIADIV